MSDFDRYQFGDMVRRCRKAIGLTQQQLGDMLGTSNVAVSQFESGKTVPGVGTVVDIAKALGVSYGILFGDPLALAEHAVAQVRAEVRKLGYDIALIPLAEAEHQARLAEETT